MSTLFLDRDGVINIEKNGSYIFSKDEFIPYEGAIEAIAKAAKIFNRIIIITNQRGIGKGLMTEENLFEIHEYLQSLLAPYQTKIDGFYFAPNIESDHPNRKPNIGMGLQAQRDFPEIDFRESTMIGNNLSDMQFGKNLGMDTVFLHTTGPKQNLPNPLIDQQFSSLIAWADQLTIK